MLVRVNSFETFPEAEVRVGEDPHYSSVSRAGFTETELRWIHDGLGQYLDVAVQDNTDAEAEFPYIVGARLCAELALDQGAGISRQYWLGARKTLLLRTAIRQAGDDSGEPPIFANTRPPVSFSLAANMQRTEQLVAKLTGLATIRAEGLLSGENEDLRPKSGFFELDSGIVIPEGILGARSAFAIIGATKQHVHAELGI